MNVFLSYTIRDGIVDVTGLRRIAKGLEAFSNPYIDLLEHRCGGHQPSVWNALFRADAFLLCMTPRVFHSPWVQFECHLARKLGIPFLATPSSKLLDESSKEIGHLFSRSNFLSLPDKVMSAVRGRPELGRVG